jgi:hypothetical protein
MEHILKMHWLNVRERANSVKNREAAVKNLQSVVLRAGFRKDYQQELA